MGTIDFVYVIYSADVRSYRESFIERMAPADHMPAGHKGLRKRVRELVGARFTQTEGNEEYEYGYLGKDQTPPDIRYFPYGYLDSKGTVLPDDDYEGETGEGQHRKWCGELTGAEWRIFADAYYIELDADGLPAEYNETMGALTKYGAIPAVAVDNTEGWEDGRGTGSVIDSNFYISIAMTRECAVCGTKVLPNETDDDVYVHAYEGHGDHAAAWTDPDGS